jgi:hypothetical protein
MYRIEYFNKEGQQTGFVVTGSPLAEVIKKAERRMAEFRASTARIVCRDNGKVVCLAPP